MSTKCWRRLAGCIAISVSLSAAAPEFRAGAAAVDHVRAVVIEDKRGGRAVFAEADFPVTRSTSDFVAIQIVKSYGIDRGAIVISGKGDSAEEPAAVLDAVERAMGNLMPANLSLAGVISVRTADGACLATLYPVRLSGCGGGQSLNGSVRGAFQMVDLPHPLQTREQTAPAYPVQAVAIGKATILALGGEAPAGKFPGLVVPNANDTTAYPNDPLVESAIANVLKRVR
jgi:hypothetical protein